MDEIVHSSQKIFNVGKHEFPILFCLPDKLPSSYEGPHGYVRFWCKATLTHSEKKRIACSRLFTVISPIDLNFVKNLNLSHCTSDKWVSKNFCINRQGLQQMECSITKTGFVPGETITVYFVIDNQRPKPILSLEIALKQVVKFIGKSSKSGDIGFKEVAFGITSVADQCPIEGYGCKKCNLKLKIPPVPPSLLYSSLVEISYRIQVKCGKRLKATLPVTIGTVMMGQTNEELQQVIAKRESLQKVNAFFSNNSPMPVFQDCILSNCQSKFKNKDAECCLNELNYVPKCLYYEFS